VQRSRTSLRPSVHAIANWKLRWVVSCRAGDTLIGLFKGAIAELGYNVATVTPARR
jgi:hypothetical protein